MPRLLFLLCLFAALPASATGAEPPEPAAVAVAFGKRCGGCHTLGEGDRAGPDLLGVLQRRDKAWVTKFLHSPGAAIDSGDKVANELLVKFKGVRMPDQAFTDEEVATLFDYLGECTTRGGCKLVLGKVRKAGEASAEEIARGQRLFEGNEVLEAGGAACISCHNVRDIGILGGGTLAKDLTFAYARLGDTGMTAALASTPFPLMKDVFGKRPLKDAEAFALKAFLASTSCDGAEPRPDHNFLYLGIVGLFAALGLIGNIWSDRLKGVRQGLLHRGDK